MSEPVPGPDNDYQATPTQTFSREVWNVVMASIAARLKARELLEATFEALIADGTQQALDLIAVNVAPQLSEIAADIAALQAQVDGFLDAGAAPNALQLGGQNPAYYLALEHATGTLPIAHVSGVDAAIDAAIAALKAGVDPAFDTLVEIAAKLADDDTAIAGILSALGNRVRVDTAAQGLNGTQKGNALTNLGFSTLGKTLAAVADAAALRTEAELTAPATASFASQAQAKAGSDTATVMSPARTAEAIAALASMSGALVAYNFYTSSQTIVIPAGATKALVRMVGADVYDTSTYDAYCTAAAGGLIKFLTGLVGGNTLVFTSAARTSSGTNPRAGTTNLEAGTQSIPATLTCPGANGGSPVAPSGGDIHFSPFKNGVNATSTRHFGFGNVYTDGAGACEIMWFK